MLGEKYEVRQDCGPQPDTLVQPIEIAQNSTLIAVSSQILSRSSRLCTVRSDNYDMSEWHRRRLSTWQLKTLG